MWYIYTMEYYSAIKKNEFMKFLAKWMDLEGIILPGELPDFGWDGRVAILQGPGYN